MVDKRHQMSALGSDADMSSKDQTVHFVPATDIRSIAVAFAQSSPVRMNPRPTIPSSTPSRGAQFAQPLLVDEASSVVRFFLGCVGLLNNRAYRVVDVLQLCNELGCEPSIAIADQRDVTTESCQFAFLSGRVVTECISVGDQALDCRCCGEGHAVVVGSMLVNLSVGFLCRLAHEPR